METAPVTRSAWHTARGPIPLDRPRLAGILNVTPDSFWDGGRHAGLDRAIRHAAHMVEEGADILDVGGESTRPGARSVPLDEERARVMPVVRELARRFPAVPVSVDTVKAAIAVEALAEGAAIINDVSALRLDPELGAVVAGSRAGLILMHSRGAVDRMATYDTARYGDDVVGDVVRELSQAVARAEETGVDASRIVLDPGLGFSKRTAHSAAVLGHLPRLVELGYPVLVGPSRKRFVGELGGGLEPAERLEGSLAACVVALLGGARLFRMHDVAPARRALDVAEALRIAT